MAKRRERPIAITGVSGYVGQHLLRHIGKEGPRSVVGVDMSTPLYSPPNLKFFNLDVRQEYLGEVLAREKCEAVVHLAFILNPGVNARLMHEFNVEGTRNVLAAAARAGAKRVIVMSSTAVYGANADNPPFITEDRPLRGHPGFPYVRDQTAVERLAAEAMANGAGVTVLRPCIVYGRRTRSFLLDFLRNMPVLPMPDGADPPLQFIHVDDLARAIQLALSRERNGAYNIIGRGTVRYSEAAHILRKRAIYMPRALAHGVVDLLGLARMVKGAPSYVLDFVSYPWVADGAKAERELGFLAKYTSREALEALLHN
ncbi:MAG: NAD-dependent epimerase/dehydratase family protein [Deltaproteobacteria bacterium]|nr:NAD-dependent epimerase/dehydratase family protein [Deltaproteobacteria bacterium]